VFRFRFGSGSSVAHCRSARHSVSIRRAITSARRGGDRKKRAISVLRWISLRARLIRKLAAFFGA